MYFAAFALPFLVAGVSASPTKGDASIKTRDYAPGWCGVHVYQTYAANQEDWLIGAEIFDANQKSLGDFRGEYVEGDSSVHMQAEDLPNALEIIPRTDDVCFNYATDEWCTSDGPCSLGGWDGPEGMEIRQMDCGFTC